MIKKNKSQKPFGVDISQWINTETPRINHTPQFGVQPAIQLLILTSEMIRGGWIDTINTVSTVTAKNFII